MLVTKQAGKFTQKTQDIHRFKSEIHQLNRIAADAKAIDSAVNAAKKYSANAASATIGKNQKTSALTEMAVITGAKRPREEPEVIIIE